jgi:hypothetical protein
MTSTTNVVHHPFGMDPCDQQNHPIFNATTQKRNAVDPRTGLFEAYVPLPSIVGGNGDGPVVDMSLFYSPLVNNHAGLGDGWSFAYTCYREEQEKLTLHSGEVVDVKKGKNISEMWITVTWLDGEVWVERPGGCCEKLKRVGDSKIWMPSEIFNSQGKVSLAWEQESLSSDSKEKYSKLLLSEAEKAALNDSFIRLKQVESDGRKLVGLEYTETQVTLMLWPDEESERLSYTLTLSDHALKRVEASTGDGCVMKYKDHAQCGYLLSELTTFEGGERGSCLRRQWAYVQG